MGDEPEEIAAAENQDGTILHIARHSDGNYLWSVEVANGAMWIELSGHQTMRLMMDLWDGLGLAEDLKIPADAILHRYRATN